MEAVSFLISFLIYLLVAMPVCLVFHELGHASMVLLLTRQKAIFQFGQNGKRLCFQLRRLTILVHPEPGALFACSYRLEDYAGLTRRQDFWITAGGPLTSLFLTILCGWMWRANDGADPWTGLAIINLVLFLDSVIPLHYPSWRGLLAGAPNDGLQLVQLFRHQKSR